MYNVSVIETPFFCERDGLRIRGMQYFPNGEQRKTKYPVIIVSHGFLGNYISEADYCRAFAKMGYVAFSFNFCGGGRIDEDTSLKSEGESTKTTILTEVEDLIVVKDYVKELPFVDEKNIILAGISQGGLVSGLTAAKCKDEIKKLIMIYPALCIPDHARRGCLGGAQYVVNNVPEIIDCKKTQLGKIFHDTVVSMDVFLELSAYKGPVLILQGLEDEIVNYSYAIRAKESYEKGQCHLQLLRNVGHSLNEKQKESAVASIRQFLLERIELLTIRVIITSRETVSEGDYRKSKIYFTGYCDTEYFHGTILPGGCDTQEYFLGELTKVRAEYTLQGIDMEGEKCNIHIINQKRNGEWKPAIETDSKNLAWFNNADLTAVIEGSKEGPTVRIYGQLT
ncbi:MAG: prolyl oligopeptidase family serine peptidase [Epulopiscium sp.]|nr:prolyl oligopeptidase family serine peptidase [Candidatus Epulonipiscium sp.]